MGHLHRSDRRFGAVPCRRVCARAARPGAEDHRAPVPAARARRISRGRAVGAPAPDAGLRVTTRTLTLSLSHVAPARRGIPDRDRTARGSLAEARAVARSRLADPAGAVLFGSGA